MQAREADRHAPPMQLVTLPMQYLVHTLVLEVMHHQYVLM
jgi:hypothetical protein